MKKASSADQSENKSNPIGYFKSEAQEATAAQSGESTEIGKSAGARSLWLWVVGGFLLLLIAWAVLFTVARSVKIESVPGPTKGGEAR